MIPIINYLIGIIILIIIGFIDILTYNKKNGYIPSVLTTLTLMIAFVLGINNNPTMTIEIGIFAGLVALLFVDLDLFSGIADAKVFIAVAMLLPSIHYFLIFALMTTIFAVLFKLFIVSLITKGRQSEFPFILVLLIAFLIAGGWTI